MKVYVSGALKGSRDLAQARSLYEQAAQVVEAAGHDAYLPHQHTDPERAADVPPIQIYHRDVEALTKSDGVLAFLGEPSLGVGAELALCVQAGVPILGLHRPTEDISRFATGLLETAGCQVVCFVDGDQMEYAIRGFLTHLSHGFESGV